MLLLALFLHAHAFSPAIHRGLAVRAVELESISHPVPSEHAAAFYRGAAGEDWNIARKWLFWHHYYNPAFRVRSLWRRPSDERVAMLDVAVRAAFARRDDARGWLLAGFLVHHVQDMASPPHVVPVAHGLFDAFESKATRALLPSLTGTDVPDLDAIPAHRVLADATLAALGEPILCESGPLATATIWTPRAGRFGRSGSRFGRDCKAGAALFLHARLDAALAYSRAVVRYVGRLD